MRAGQGPSHRGCRRHRPPGATGAQRRLRTACLLQADWPACMQLSVQRLEAEREQFGGEAAQSCWYSAILGSQPAAPVDNTKEP